MQASSNNARAHAMCATRRAYIRLPPDPRISKQLHGLECHDKRYKRKRLVRRRQRRNRLAELPDYRVHREHEQHLERQVQQRPPRLVPARGHQAAHAERRHDPELDAQLEQVRAQHAGDPVYGVRLRLVQLGIHVLAHLDEHRDQREHRAVRDRRRRRVAHEVEQPVHVRHEQRAHEHAQAGHARVERRAQPRRRAAHDGRDQRDHRAVLPRLEHALHGVRKHEERDVDEVRRALDAVQRHADERQHAAQRQDVPHEQLRRAGLKNGRDLQRREQHVAEDPDEHDLHALQHVPVERVRRVVNRHLQAHVEHGARERQARRASALQL